jgi:hypothetical protein
MSRNEAGLETIAGGTIAMLVDACLLRKEVGGGMSALRIPKMGGVNVIEKSRSPGVMAMLMKDHDFDTLDSAIIVFGRCGKVQAAPRHEICKRRMKQLI